MRLRSAWMRIAGLRPPCTETWPTPVTSLRRWAIMVSARSLICAQRDGRRRQRERHHRRVGRVHLGIGRRIGKVARQGRAGGIDGGLQVLRGAVDVAVEVELQGDLADPVGARRRHDRQRGNLAELAFQRRGDQRGHGLGIGAGKLGGHLDGGEVDLGQRSHRQQRITENAAQHHRDPEQGRRDRPRDEGRRDVHGEAVGERVSERRCGPRDVSVGRRPWGPPRAQVLRPRRGGGRGRRVSAPTGVGILARRLLRLRSVGGDGFWSA